MVWVVVFVIGFMKVYCEWMCGLFIICEVNEVLLLGCDVGCFGYVFYWCGVLR